MLENKVRMVKVMIMAEGASSLMNGEIQEASLERKLFKCPPNDILSSCITQSPTHQKHSVI